MLNHFVIRTLRTADLPWVKSEHRRHYTEIEHFDDSFGPVVDTALENFFKPASHSLNKGFLLECQGERSGSIFCQFEDDRRARLKLFYLCAAQRSQGLGQQLLDKALAYARQHGAVEVVVSTYSAHQAACALYAKNDFFLEQEKPVQAFGRALVEQHWRYRF